jgi:RNA polymerase sigma-70 factor (ECF subfamily)
MSSVGEDEAQVLNRHSHQQFHRGDLEARLISRDLAHKLLGQLSADDRLVLTLLEVEEFSVAEIAKVTDWSVAKVKVRAHRARAALRRVLNDFV